MGGRRTSEEREESNDEYVYVFIPGFFFSIPNWFLEREEGGRRKKKG